MFCETRWVEKTLYLKTFRRCMEDFQMIYEPLIQFLKSITSTDGWDGKCVIHTSGL